MAGVLYCTVDQCIDMIGRATFDTSAGPDSDTQLLTDLIEALSRAVDRETGKAANWWGPQTGVTRFYSGTGTMFVDIDPFDTITTVSVSAALDRSDASTLQSATPNFSNYYVPYPLSGPPYYQLFRPNFYWFPDVYGIGNVRVTGNVATPPELSMAVRIWAAQLWNRMRANWADRVRVGSRGPQLEWTPGKPPDEVMRLIGYFRGDEERVWFS